MIMRPMIHNANIIQAKMTHPSELLSVVVVEDVSPEDEDDALDCFNEEGFFLFFWS